MKWTMKWILRYFFQGLIILLPVFATTYFVYKGFTWVDRNVSDRFPVLHLPGMGVLVTLAFITLVGFLGSLFIFQSLVELMDRVLRKLPFVKLLYGSLKDLISAFVGEKKSFDQPVIVSLVKDSTARVIGFVTRKDLEFLGLKNQVAVYLPQSYNFAGNLIVLPSSDVQAINAESSTVMTFLVSGGVSSSK